MTPATRPRSGARTGARSPGRIGRPGPGAGRLVLITDEVALADPVEGLAAAAGAELTRLTGLARTQPGDLVLIGVDRLGEAVAAGSGHEVIHRERIDLVVVAHEQAEPAIWQDALTLGAEQVAVLPASRAWLLDRMLDALSGQRTAAVIAVVGGRGGAGASTLAAALSVTAARSGLEPVLVDLDPLGGGLDVVIGAQDEPGLRWDDLSAVAGRLQPGLLRSGLPQACGVRVLSWDRGGQPACRAEAVAAVLDALTRESRLVVMDLPRRLDEAVTAALRWAGQVLLVVPAEVQATAAAGRVVAQLEPLCRRLRLVVRGPAPTGLSADAVADALCLPLAGDMRAESGLAAALDRGLAPPVRVRGPLAVLCRRVTAELALEIESMAQVST